MNRNLIISELRIIIENPTDNDVTDFEVFPGKEIILSDPDPAATWRHGNYTKDGVTVTLDTEGHGLWKVKTYYDFITGLKLGNISSDTMISHLFFQRLIGGLNCIRTKYSYFDKDGVRVKNKPFMDPYGRLETYAICDLKLDEKASFILEVVKARSEFSIFFAKQNIEQI